MITCKFEDGGPVSLRHVVVTTILHDKEKSRVLLTRRAPFLLEGNKLTLPGGYMDRDEMLTETIVREVLEETGYQATVGTLFRINDNPHRIGENDRQNINLIFLMQIGKKIQKPDKETTELVWIDISKLPKEDEIAFDHYEDLCLYKKYLDEHTFLPILGKIGV